MQSTSKNTRGRIVDLADQLFYEHGFQHTSFADIAAAVGLSRGNFYHHFKTKDEILDAVIARRVDNTQEMLHRWTAEAQTPIERLACFIQMMVMNGAKIRKHGCPVGTLCTELAKLEHPSQPKANMLLSLFREWLASQFSKMVSKRDAQVLAMHLLARSQGIATLAHAFDDEAFIQQEVAQLLTWLHTLPAPRHSAKKGK